MKKNAMIVVAAMLLGCEAEVQFQAGQVEAPPQGPAPPRYLEAPPPVDKAREELDREFEARVVSKARGFWTAEADRVLWIELWLKYYRDRRRE